MEIDDAWGTWGELILVSAVLRHGAADWDAVVEELRARMPAPEKFTPEVCKVKYEDLQQHYSTCSDLLEELRKQRIAELRRTLEQSDGSIGCQQTKLQTLKAKREHSSSVGCQSSPLESPAQTSEGQSSGKETSNDGLSAGSFTEEIRKTGSCLVKVSATQHKIAQTGAQTSVSSKQQKISIAEDLLKNIQMESGISFKKKRGKRKRRGCTEYIKEETIVETALVAANENAPLLSRIKVEPTSECVLANASSPDVADESNHSSDQHKFNDLTGLFDLVSSKDFASIFRRRLDGQKRARYRNTVRQHVDLDTIKSKIDRKAITSAKEVLRDLLLLATNAVIFYSKNTREHKYAAILRGIVMKLIMEHCQNPSSSLTPATTSPAVADVPPVSLACILLEKSGIVHTSDRKSPENANRDEDTAKSSQQGAKKSRKSKVSNPIAASNLAKKVDCQSQNGGDGSKQQSPDLTKKYGPAKRVKSQAPNGVNDSKQQPAGPTKISVQAKRVVHSQAHTDGYESELQPSVEVTPVTDSKERKRARKR